ncbi:hypothetical protein IJF86_00205 [Candidatus Saccharibacteria bacterium]|nr:hypothetical protein [Candidatus Saccharibacteria bacterium]
MKNNGSKNLILLGCIAIFIAILTSGISLFVYHDSGDIYLDRSRPGFLPDQQEIEKQNYNSDYSFSDFGGNISADELEEYINNLNEFKEKLNAIPDPFSPESLSDESLNIAK